MTARSIGGDSLSQSRSSNSPSRRAQYGQVKSKLSEYIQGRGHPPAYRGNRDLLQQLNESKMQFEQQPEMVALNRSFGEASETIAKSESKSVVDISVQDQQA